MRRLGRICAVTLAALAALALAAMVAAQPASAQLGPVPPTYNIRPLLIGPTPAPWPVDISGLSPSAVDLIPWSIPSGGATTVGVGRMSGLNITGPGAIVSPGHAVATLCYNVANNVTAALLISCEGKIDVLAGSNVAQVILSDMNLNQVQTGATVGAIYGGLVQFQNLNSPSTVLTAYGAVLNNAPAAGQTVPLFAGLFVSQPAAIGGNINVFALNYQQDWSAVPGYANIGAKYFGLNQDKNFLFQTAAPILGAAGHEEYSPSPGAAAGAYYFGAGWSSISALALGTTLGYCELFDVPERTTFTKMGMQITSGQSTGKNLQWAVYKTTSGWATGAPVYTSPNHSAAAAGVLEDTGLSVTLEAGAYVDCAVTDVASNGLTVEGYVDPHAAGLWGTHSSNSAADSLPYIGPLTVNAATPSATWPTNPTVAGWANTGNLYPQIWMRK